MTPTPGESPENPEIVEAVDPRDFQLATLQTQVESLEAFLNVVISQRNDAQNQVAQVQSQLIKLQKGIQQ